MNKELTDLLAQAAVEPQYRPHFLACLLQTEVYCLAKNNTMPSNQLIELTDLDQLQFQKWENSRGLLAIPFFLSLDELQQSIQTPHSYIKLPVPEFFKLTLGDHLVLNPMSKFGKPFSPEEIQFLIADKKPEPDVILAEPEPYPIQLVEQLKILFKQYKNVTKAYAVVMYQDIQSKPQLVIGIEVTADIQKIMAVLDQFDFVELPKFIQIESLLNTVTEYMVNEVQPFYDIA